MSKLTFASNNRGMKSYLISQRYEDIYTIIVGEQNYELILNSTSP